MSVDRPQTPLLHDLPLLHGAVSPVDDELAVGALCQRSREFDGFSLRGEDPAGPLGLFRLTTHSLLLGITWITFPLSC